MPGSNLVEAFGSSGSGVAPRAPAEAPSFVRTCSAACMHCMSIYALRHALTHQGIPDPGRLQSSVCLLCQGRLHSITVLSVVIGIAEPCVVHLRRARPSFSTHAESSRSCLFSSGPEAGRTLRGAELFHHALYGILSCCLTNLLIAVERCVTALRQCENQVLNVDLRRPKLCSVIGATVSETTRTNVDYCTWSKECGLCACMCVSVCVKVVYGML